MAARCLPTLPEPQRAQRGLAGSVRTDSVDPAFAALERGWEVDKGRLFLAPPLFDELLLVHYLVSRSQKAGGLTLEGRYTLRDLRRGRCL